MLDKSVPFLNVLMKRPAGAPIPDAPLQEGFSFHFYTEGDEKDWAEIEASVLEFSRAVDALVRFQAFFGDSVPELKRRCLFVADDKGYNVGTATIWWEYSGKRRDPWVSWVGVRPEYQGLGLGKALVSRLLQEAVEIEGDRAFYLHTQTWSHPAIRLYEKFGFCITDEPNLFKYKNDEHKEAKALLKEIYQKAGIRWEPRT